MMHDILDWLEMNRQKSNLKVKPLLLPESHEWLLDTTGNVIHRTGGFFSLVGVKSTSSDGTLHQPLIHQPEIGILGFLIRPTTTSFEILCQAKTEPGNIQVTQIAPTFQATESNYTCVHGGQRQPFSDYFLAQNPVFVTNQLQSEQGFRFWKKRNRNCVIALAADENPEVPMSHRWISIEWILENSHRDYLFNTDFRSVLVQLFFGHLIPAGTLLSWVMGWTQVFDPTMLNVRDVETWISQRKARAGYVHTRVPLANLPDWQMNPSGIHADDRTFGVRYFDITCDCREVSHWDQPLMTSHVEDRNVLVVAEKEQTLFFLLQFRIEPGAYDGGELSCTYHSQDRREEQFYPRQLAIDELPSHTVLTFRTSEEGGRFFQNKTQNELWQVDELFDSENENYRWVCLEELCILVQQSNKLTNELRTILSILPGCPIMIRAIEDSLSQTESKR